MAISYKILLAGFVCISLMFGLSPRFALHQIHEAANQHNQAKWQQLINTDVLEKYAAEFLTGLAELKLSADMEKDVAKAVTNNRATNETIPLLARQFSDSQGITHLLCGEVTTDPHSKVDNKGDCWTVDGDLRWQSLTQVEVSFKNPETNWQSVLTLERTGLFAWQVIAIRLPVDDILSRFAKQIGLKTNTAQNAV